MGSLERAMRPFEGAEQKSQYCNGSSLTTLIGNVTSVVRTKWMARQFKNHLSIVKDALFSGVFRGQKSRHGILLYRHLCKSYGGKGIGKLLNGKKMSFYI